MEQLYKNQRTLMQMREGVLGAYVEALSKQLRDEGYANASVRNALQLLADLGRWLSLRRMTASQLTPECLQGYLKYRSKHGHHRSTDAATLQRLSNLLLAEGAIAPSMRSEPTPAQRLEEEFRHYLELERGLATATVHLYLPFVSRFLAECFTDGRLRLDSLCATDVVRFVQREAARLNHPKRAKLMTTALRAFLQYARYRDLIGTDLRLSVPTVASWTMASLPRALSSEDVQHLLNHCDRQTAIGCRNWAILLLLARLGLRAGEVVGLTLDDIDWERGELRIRANGKGVDLLPIPQDVGAALADYLRRLRPAFSCRQVFVRMRAPYRGFASSVAICSIVRRALDHAGLNPAHKGAHLLRHSVATHMLRQGASLAEIGALLRHHSPQTTMIYAKVDLDLLRPLAMPWPGGAQ
ncbi:MAG: site-specific integrase [Gallionella sp.]|nr:site-specific integrase [Gallionella sp.]